MFGTRRGETLRLGFFSGLSFGRGLAEEGGTNLLAVF